MTQYKEASAPLTGLRGHRVLNPEKRSARRQEILLSMAGILAEKGYEAATLDDVANAMGCSKAVIYYQFRSKAELFTALVEEVHRTAIAWLREIADMDAPPEAQLRAAVTELVRRGWQPMDYASIRIRRPASLPLEARAHLRALDREFEGLFIDIVTRGMEAGVLIRRDPRLVAFTLINAVHSVFRWARPDGALSPETFVKEVPLMVLEGVLQRPEGAGTG